MSCVTIHSHTSSQWSRFPHTKSVLGNEKKTHLSLRMIYLTNYSSIMLAVVIFLLSTLTNVHCVCDTTVGCYPPVFEIQDKFAGFPARSIFSSSTCGSNSSSPVQYLSLISSDVNLYTCQPATIQPINVVDGEGSLLQPTYWQSDKMVETVGATPHAQYIVFNFTDEFILHTVIITFRALHVQSAGNSVDARPLAFSIEKKDSSNGNWTALEHFSRDCGKYFPGIPVYQPFDVDPDSTHVLCEQYPDEVDATPYDDYFNEVEYSPGLRYDSSDNQFKNNLTALARYSVSAIRIYIHQPANLSPLKSYIAISDVFIEAQCKCFGHADSCGGQNNATCNCQHNTTGQQCNSCQPLFNNRSWIPGSTIDSGLCLACTCNSRADSCQFDQVKGHGLCIGCKENSTGDACDSCVSGFYINPLYMNGSISISSNLTAAQTSGAVNGFCRACNCSQDGTQASSLSICNVTTGQCVCKDRVTQRDCSSCLDTFWGLSANNSLGCSVCNCNPQGSIGSINMCNKTTGECLCKANVEGSICDKCKLNTYNFDIGNPDGCKPCDCDPGASTGQTCDLLSGQCSCYSNIAGRDCRLPIAGFFVPRLDALVLEPEKYATQNVILRSGHGTQDATVSGRGFVKLTSGNKISINFTSPLSAVVDIVLRFEKTTNDSFVFLQGKLSLKSGTSYNCSNGQIIPVGKQWALTFSNIIDDTRGGGNMGRVCLYSGAVYNIEITSPTSAMLVDSVVVMLDTASVSPVIKTRLNPDNVTQCIQSTVSTVRSGRDHCAKIEYSLAAAVLQSAVSCSCVGGALASPGCNAYSGDCNCLPGVLTPDCSQCMVDSYQFSMQTGCTACGCHVNGSDVDYCDEQGICHCLPHVQGPKCDSCFPENTGLHTGMGCHLCQCNMMYSINNNCSDYGQCTCRPGVGGLSCDSCQEGHYNLTSSGCTQCACDQNGSTQQSCDVTTGTCQCLPRTEGSTCSQCKPGYYGLGKWRPEGCISCFCWGHGQNCSSALGWYDSPVSSSWLASNQSLLGDIWQAEDMNGTRVGVLTPLINSVNGSQYAVRTNETQRGSSSIFYIAPIKFLGDKKSSYGRFLSIVLKPSPGNSLQPLPDTNVSSNEMNTSAITVQLSGETGNLTLVYTQSRSNITSTEDIIINAPISESRWQVVMVTSEQNTTYTTATYSQLMEVLGRLVSLKILAYQANVSSSAVDLISVKLDSAVDGSRSTVHGGLAVNNVEMCACEPGYTGNSCEECAQHYTRAITNSTNPISLCVPCDCNGHGVIECQNGTSTCSAESVRACDPHTGICTCGHNTEGDHCEICLPGYYGDPKKGTKDDCLPCACPGKIVANETNVFATSCIQTGTSDPVCVNCSIGHAGNNCEICVDGYFGTPENATKFGGACQPCECNGHADTCDPRTGQCVNCSNNTAGHNCDVCAPGYFGNAVNLTCQPCACNYTGSTGSCNPATGSCECLPNVSGAVCDFCIDETYNLTAGAGCQTCNCSVSGSTGLVCNKTSGQCPCRNLVTGQYCNQCLSSYWNVNNVTGCDACQCNPVGTLQENGAAVNSCDVTTGQCSCAVPGIVGRTCDHCSPVSKNAFEYVSLIYIGTYPSCQLCGECFDTWALRIEEIGQDLALMSATVYEIWSAYEFQTAAQVNSNLTSIEENINRTVESLNNFEDVANQIMELQARFSEALTKEDLLSKEVEMLSQTEQSLSSTLNTLMALTDVVAVTNATLVALTTLQQQFNELLMEAVGLAAQGNASWIHIQSLNFVVSTPEDRERQLRDQVSKLMELLSSANRTLLLMRALYDTSLTPGVAKNAQQITSISETAVNVTATLAEVNSVATSVQVGIRNSSNSLSSLLTEAAEMRVKMLAAVLSLQEYITNASKAQKAAEKLFTDVKTFKTVAEKAEQTIINSTVALLQYITILEQAEDDLTQAVTMSSASLDIDIPSQASMQQMVEQIANSSLSAADVSSLKMRSQQAKFTSDQSVMSAQRALSLSQKLNDDVKLMDSDILASQDLRAQAQVLHAACDSLNNSIGGILQQAKNRSDVVIADVTLITHSAQEMQAEIKNLSLCLTQRQLDVTNAVTAANQLKGKADSASSNQLQLLQIMLQINSNNLADVSQTLFNLTEAGSVMRQVNTDLEQVESLAQIEVLIRDLQSQNQEINSLDQEVTQLTSQLDSIILMLEESAGAASCTTV